ncbi:MAG: hypothetical protein ACP5I4_05130 [Oceanipulchritudo sp.]
MSLEDFRELERELRSARPVQPRSSLRREIELGLQKAARRRRLARLRSITAWGGLAAAASILVVFGILLFNGRLPVGKGSGPAVPALAVDSAPSRPDDEFQAVLAENNLKNRIDEGIVFLRNGLTARRYRYEFIDRVVWENPASGAVVEMEIPREEVVLVPVQTF